MQLPKIKKRDPQSHKGTYGHALVVGGSRGMTGAPALTGISAVYAGAGLVTVTIPERCLETVAGFFPCYMTVPLADNGQGRLGDTAEMQLLALSQRATSIGIGPGLTVNDTVQKSVVQLCSGFSGPLVIDADALNAIAEMGQFPLSNGPRILTPHIGEFRRLLQLPELSADECRQRAQAFAHQHHVVLVLKDHRTLVTDGESVFLNETGNPGMATGGSGDVLTGVITGLLAQGYSDWDAATLGVHVHGLAGDFACRRYGEISLSADRIAGELAPAFLSLQ